MTPSTRCAAHPARPAVDACPVCHRGRCGADAAGPVAGGCTVCRGSRTGVPAPVVTRRPADNLERTVRAALAGSAVALAWGFVAAEYVGADVFKYLSPAVLGVLSGAATQQAGVTNGTGMMGRRTRVIGIVYALLGVAFGFVKEDPEHGLSLHLDELVAYLIAGAAAFAWTLPPKPRRTPAQDVSGSRG